MSNGITTFLLFYNGLLNFASHHIYLSVCARIPFLYELPAQSRVVQVPEKTPAKLVDRSKHFNPIQTIINNIKKKLNKTGTFLYFYKKTIMNIIEIFNKKSLFSTRNVGGELILVPVKNKVADMNEIFTLNEVGCFIWDNIDGKKNMDDIVNILVSEFDVDEDTARNDLSEFLERVNKLMVDI